MKRLEVLSLLAQVKEARETRAEFVRDLTIGIDTAMRRLLYEAVANYMSPEEIARASGHTTKRIRQWLRELDLNPTTGKTVLSKRAAAALATNAELLGIEPGELLMSPLAYLPMGAKMRRELENAHVSSVTEDEVSGNDEDAVYVLTSWDNPEGGMYEGVFKTQREAETFAWVDLQERDGAEPVWVEGRAFNDAATYGMREMRIEKVEL